MTNQNTLRDATHTTAAGEGLLPCPFCGSKPRVELGKRGSCQLHGEPFQAVLIRCAKHECPAKPSVADGDIFNGGERKARQEAIAAWNTRSPHAAASGTETLVDRVAVLMERCRILEEALWLANDAQIAFDHGNDAEYDRLFQLAHAARRKALGKPHG